MEPYPAPCCFFLFCFAMVGFMAISLIVEWWRGY